MLGYEDDGKATGITPSDLSASIKTLRVMMEAVGAKVANMQVIFFLWITHRERATDWEPATIAWTSLSFLTLGVSLAGGVDFRC